MRSCNFTPNTSDLWVVSFFGGSVDESYSLSKVESIWSVLILCSFVQSLLCSLSIINTFYLEQWCVWVCISFSSLIWQMLALDIDCKKLSVHHHSFSTLSHVFGIDWLTSVALCSHIDGCNWLMILRSVQIVYRLSARGWRGEWCCADLVNVKMVWHSRHQNLAFR